MIVGLTEHTLSDNIALGTHLKHLGYRTSFDLVSTLESGLKKLGDSYAGFTGYVWTEAEIANKTSRIKKCLNTCGRGPEESCSVWFEGKRIC